MKLVAGIDVGGTNTDAVLVRDTQIVGWAKVPSTADVYSRIIAALKKIGGAPSATRVHLGTTACTNALVERRDLAPTAEIRAGKAVSEPLPPMTDWPDDLRAAVSNQSYFVSGGCEYDGRPIGTVNRAEIAEIARRLGASATTQAAVTSVFGTLYPDDEVRIADWLVAENPQLQVSLSHKSAGLEFSNVRTPRC